MSERRKKLRGSTASLNAIPGLEGLLAFDRQLKEMRVFDGVTLGGFRIPNMGTIDSIFAAKDAALASGYYTKSDVDSIFAANNAALVANFYDMTATDSLLLANKDASDAALSAATVGKGLGVVGTAALLASVDTTTIPTGQYRFDNTTTGTFPGAIEKASGGIVTVERRLSNEAKMEMYNLDNTPVARRFLNAGVWGTWTTVVIAPAGNSSLAGLQLGDTANTGLYAPDAATISTLIAGTPVLKVNAARTDLAAPLTVRRIGGNALTYIPSYATCGGTANALTLTTYLGTVPSAQAPEIGTQVYFKPLNSNTGASTINLNGTGAIQCSMSGRGSVTPTTAGFLYSETSSGFYSATYDGTAWQVVPCSASGVGSNYSWHADSTGLLTTTFIMNNVTIESGAVTTLIINLPRAYINNLYAVAHTFVTPSPDTYPNPLTLGVRTTTSLEVNILRSSTSTYFTLTVTGRWF